MKPRKRPIGWSTLIVLLLGLVYLGGCSSRTEDKQVGEKNENLPVNQAISQITVDSGKSGGTLTISLDKDISVMNPLVDMRSINKIIRGTMYEPLVGRKQNGSTLPGLAERWDISPDGLEYVFYLRPNVKFHNNKVLDANDVKWTIDYVLDSKNGAYGASDLKNIASVEVVDDLTIKIKTKQVQAAFLFLLSDSQSFVVLPKGSLDTGQLKPDEMPPGTGPFKFMEWKPGNYLSVIRHDNYWRKAPYLDKVIFKPVESYEVRFAAVRAGDVDAIYQTPYQWIKKIKEGEIKGLKIAEASAGEFRRLIFNVQSPPLDNKKVRQAMAHAIDRNEYLSARYWGFGEPTNEKMAPGSEFRINMMEKPDISKAKQLLAEAGYPDGLEIKAMVRVGEEVEAQIVQNQLAQAGIKLVLDIVEYGIRQDRQRSGDFKLYFSGGSPHPDPSINLFRDFYTNPSPQRQANTSGYSDPEMDILLEALSSEMNNGKRKDIYGKVVNKFWEDVPELYIAFAPTFWTFREHVMGFDIDPNNQLVWTDGGLQSVWIEK